MPQEGHLPGKLGKRNPSMVGIRERGDGLGVRRCWSWVWGAQGFLFLKKKFIYLLGREKEQEQEGEGQREGEKQISC